MKLKNHPKFPKCKLLVQDITQCNKDAIMGYNQALQELGEIEIPEEMINEKT